MSDSLLSDDIAERRKRNEQKIEMLPEDDRSHVMIDSKGNLVVGGKSLIKALADLGVKKTTINKLTENLGDIPESVADAVIYLSEKAGILEKPKNKEPRAEGGAMRQSLLSDGREDYISC